MPAQFPEARAERLGLESTKFPRKAQTPANKTACPPQGSFLRGAAALQCAMSSAPQAPEGVSQEIGGGGAYLASALPSWMEGFRVAKGNSNKATATGCSWLGGSEPNSPGEPFGLHLTKLPCRCGPAGSGARSAAAGGWGSQGAKRGGGSRQCRCGWEGAPGRSGPGAATWRPPAARE